MRNLLRLCCWVFVDANQTLGTALQFELDFGCLEVLGKSVARLFSHSAIQPEPIALLSFTQTGSMCLIDSIISTVRQQYPVVYLLANVY
jgi:hypothetical protein